MDSNESAMTPTMTPPVTQADEDTDSVPVVGQEDQPEIEPLAVTGAGDVGGDDDSELYLSPIEVAARAAREELRRPCGLLSGLDVADDRLQRTTGMWGDVRNFIRRAEAFRRDILVPMCSAMQRETDELSRQNDLLLYQLERDLSSAGTVLLAWALRIEKAKAELQQAKRRVDGAVDC